MGLRTGCKHGFENSGMNAYLKQDDPAPMVPAFAGMRRQGCYTLASSHVPWCLIYTFDF